jgi:hypothetical protein
MQKFLRNNGLSLVLLFLFLLFWLGQAVAGWSVFNEEQLEHDGRAIGFAAYLTTPHFIEATAENWESEFLQMAAYVALTAFLFQKGSAESNDPDKHSGHVANARSAPRPKRSWGRWLYSYSLSLTLGALFIASFVIHAFGGHAQNNSEEIAHGRVASSLLDYVSGAQFWFESFQNWQSEFLAVLTIVVLSIFLRHKGSPESKPVDMPNDRNPE